ncbi:MAG: PAS domain-containing protein, partial [Ferruginibacter sp.]
MKKSIVSATNQLVNYQPGKTLRETVIVTDPHFIITGFNDIASSVYGFTSMAYGQSLFSLVKFEMIGTRKRLAAKSLFKNGYWKGNIVYKQHGKKLVLSTRCNLVKDKAGLNTSIVISTQNLSKRPTKAKDLVIAENKYQTLVESLSEGVMLIRADGTISAANKKAAEIFGITEEEFKGRTLTSPQWKTFREDGSKFPQSEYPAMVTLATGREINNVIMGLQHADGRMNWISLNSRGIFESPSVLPFAVVVSIVDITEVKEINDRLAESELLFRTFMKDSPMLGWICDKDGTLVYGNPRFLETIGFPADATGKNISGFLKSPAVLATVLKRNKSVLENARPIIKEEALTGQDGATRYYLSYWFLLPGKNKKNLIGGHAVEITDNKSTR